MDLIHNGTEQHSNAQADTPSATNGHVTEPVKSAAGSSYRASDSYDILPQKRMEVNLKETTPEAALAQLRSVPGRYVAMLLVDARGVADELTWRWLHQLDDIAPQQVKTMHPDPIHLEVVVFLPADHSMEAFAPWRDNFHYDWVATDEQGPLAEVYREILRQAFAAVCPANPREGLTPISELKDAEKGVPIIDLLTPQEREAYKPLFAQLGWIVD